MLGEACEKPPRVFCSLSEKQFLPFQDPCTGKWAGCFVPSREQGKPSPSFSCQGIHSGDLGRDTLEEKEVPAAAVAIYQGVGQTVGAKGPPSVLRYWPSLRGH